MSDKSTVFSELEDALFANREMEDHPEMEACVVRAIELLKRASRQVSAAKRAHGRSYPAPDFARHQSEKLVNGLDKCAAIIGKPEKKNVN